MSRPLPRMLTAIEAAEVLRMSPAEVKRKITAGKLLAYKPGRAYLIPEDALNAYLVSTASKTLDGAA